MGFDKTAKPKYQIVKYIKIYAICWALIYVAYCTPHRWTSIERVLKETIFRVFWPFLSVVFPFAAINGMLPICSDKMLPIEPPPPIVYITEETPLDVAYKTLLASYKNQDTIVLWKNFSQGLTEKWNDEEYSAKHLNMEVEYDFGRNLTSHLTVSLPLKEAWDKLEDLYLGFSYKFLMDNENTLYKDLKDAVYAKSDKISKIIPWDRSIHHSFLYKGKKYSTGLHQAPISDWFFQIANKKKWRFVHPNYAPYIRPFTLDGVSTMSYFDALPEDTRIPYIDVTSEAGDLMFFPRHWWHQVTNVEDGLGIGVGFRPSEEIPNNLIQAVFPFFVPYKAYAFHRVAFSFGMLKRIARKILTKYSSTMDEGSGLSSRAHAMCMINKKLHKYKPNWGFNTLSKKYGAITGPCENISKHIINWKKAHDGKSEL